MADISNVNPDSRGSTMLEQPDRMIKVRELFGIDSDMESGLLRGPTRRGPRPRPRLLCSIPTRTLAICAGLAREPR
jgi:cobaltochelatase CobS